METNADHDNDDIQLSADTLLILNQFLEEQKTRQNLATTNVEQQNDKAAFHVFEENWVRTMKLCKCIPNQLFCIYFKQLSQFWYDQSTKDKLAEACKQILETMNKSSTLSSETKQIALLSCPSLYEDMTKTNSNANVLLFEFDDRFSIYKEHFIHYDYTLADDENYLSDYNQSFDIIIADPPFLSEECISKIALLIKRFARVDTKIILCSGEKVHEWAKQFMDLDECNFKPKHNRNLANEFTSFANFNLDKFIT